MSIMYILYIFKNQIMNDGIIKGKNGSEHCQ